MTVIKEYVDRYVAERMSENLFLGHLTPEEIRSLNAKDGDKCRVIGIPDELVTDMDGKPLFSIYGQPVMAPGTTKIDGVEVQNGDILIRCNGWIKL